MLLGRMLILYCDLAPFRRLAASLQTTKSINPPVTFMSAPLLQVIVAMLQTCSSDRAVSDRLLCKSDADNNLASEI
jgi:hypothetical protein